MSKSRDCICKQGKGSLTLKEDRENKLIEKGLTYHNGHWEATYPLIKDPNELADNLGVTFAIMKSTEKRLMEEECTSNK